MTPGLQNLHDLTPRKLIGTLGGLIGPGGAGFRLPVLGGHFRLNTLKAVVMGTALS